MKTLFSDNFNFSVAKSCYKEWAHIDSGIMYKTRKKSNYPALTVLAARFISLSFGKHTSKTTFAADSFTHQFSIAPSADLSK